MISSLYGGMLALLYFRLSWETIQARRKNRISVGYGPNNEIASIVSAHNNFAAYVVFLLVLLYLLESSRMISPWVLHALGSAFTLGRALHFVAFRNKTMIFRLRVLGMQLTLFPLITLGCLNIYVFLKQAFGGHL